MESTGQSLESTQIGPSPYVFNVYDFKYLLLDA